MDKEAKQATATLEGELEMTATDMARLAGIDATYVIRLCRYGDIQARKLGRYWVVRADVAREWIAQRELRLAERKRRGELRRLARALPQLKLPGIAPEPEPEPEA